MSAPTQRPCQPWAETVDCGVEFPSSWGDGQRAALAAEMLDAASFVLWALSGRQFGVCDQVLRPCSRRCFDSYAARLLASQEVWEGSRWWLACRRCGDACSCGRLEQIRLPGYPVVDVAEILIDGEPLDESAYLVDEWQWLVRVDGEGWPTCQRLDLAADQPDTWQVAYQYGRTPPPAGVRAVKRLACEMVKDRLGDKTCALPDRVTSVNRQGVSFTVLDPNDFIDKGRTGILEVDQFLAIVNPGRQKRPTGIFRADMPSAGRRRGSWPTP